ncbi:unnamed protein product [Arabidopsis lyrata]|uniref:Predicted protein n=1 Tax=Arabidopsis lyrata subsp. lyrata TaxID=81972 RepID=D7KBD5_ARALL|nr:predicted protein [Arabidopsis lyrata subsp. lyrata]CAH8250963.1 unnamed protein product [Arabidopsis lyrata]
MTSSLQTTSYRFPFIFRDKTHDFTVTSSIATKLFFAELIISCSFVTIIISSHYLVNDKLWALGGLFSLWTQIGLLFLWVSLYSPFHLCLVGLKPNNHYSRLGLL